MTEHTRGRLNAVQLLAQEDLYYVDLGQWTVALGGAEAVALITVICGILFGREVLVPLSGITVEELAKAIKEQSVPRQIFPLRWSFKTIVGAYNNFLPGGGSTVSFESWPARFAFGNVSKGKNTGVGCGLVGCRKGCYAVWRGPGCLGLRGPRCWT